MTWLNVISDQAVGLTGKVLSGTPRDTPNVIDRVYNPDGGSRPEVLITDAGSYSDVVFGIVTLLGFDYRPVLADLPDTKLWRNDGRLTDLGEAIAYFGRIFKTLHVLTFAGDPSYRRHLKGMRNLQEQRHGSGRHVFHGRKGELYQAYAGMEGQLGALGLVLNCITLWNTLLEHALDALQAHGYPVLDADAARLSAYQYKHINVHGHYSFALPGLGDGRRPLRGPDAVEE
nr:Tn3 family transposase [Jidongwangia harbinensis]